MDDYGSWYEPDCANRVDYEKDPDETVDYSFNWALKLETDAIATSTFALPDGLTEVSTSTEGRTTSIFVSGGTRGRIYRIVNTLTTTGGRTLERTIYVKIVES
jgi:hypothetical protein